MTDTSDQAPEEAAAPVALPAEVQAEIDRIRQETADRDALAAQAVQAEDARVAALNAAKAVCAAKCAPISEALAATTDLAEQAALVEFEARTHAEHAAELEQAYLVFSGQRAGESNPVPAGGTGELVSHATAGVDAQA